MVAFARRREPKNDFLQTAALCIGLNSLEKFFCADEFLRMLFGKRHMASKHEIKSFKAAALNVVYIGVLFNNKKNSRVALRITANGAGTAASAVFDEPAETALADGGL